MNSSSDVVRPTCIATTKDETRKLDIGVNKAFTDGQDFEDPCLKISQVVTEVILIVFAASLLLLAATIILSKEIPTLMHSYDIVPKTLFFLCIIVAACSLMSWIYTKVLSRFHPKQDQTKGDKLLIDAIQDNSSLVVNSSGENHKKLISVTTYYDSNSNLNARKDPYNTVQLDSLTGLKTPTTSTIEEE